MKIDLIFVKLLSQQFLFRLFRGHLAQQINTDLYKYYLFSNVIIDSKKKNKKKKNCVNTLITNIIT